MARRVDDQGLGGVLSTDIDRRKIIKAAAWTAPVLAISVPAVAAAATTTSDIVLGYTGPSKGNPQTGDFTILRHGFAGIVQVQISVTGSFTGTSGSVGVRFGGDAKWYVNGETYTWYPTAETPLSYSATGAKKNTTLTANLISPTDSNINGNSTTVTL